MMFSMSPMFPGERNSPDPRATSCTAGVTLFITFITTLYASIVFTRATSGPTREPAAVFMTLGLFFMADSFDTAFEAVTPAPIMSPIVRYGVFVVVTFFISLPLLSVDVVVEVDVLYRILLT